MDYNKYLSETGKVIKPSQIRKFFDIVSEMKGAISLGVGEPDFLTPWEVRNSAITSIKNGLTQYTSNSGLPKLRENIARYLDIRYGLKYDWHDEVIVTIGASEAIDISLRAIINPGDEVLIPDPSYVSYAPCVTLCHGIPIALPCTCDNGFQVTAEALLKTITPRTKAIIMPYPNNPTGGIMDRQAIENIIEIVKSKDLIVISDEIYSELTYGDEPHVSIAGFDGMRERTIVINGFSKAFAMTGWRVGYVAAPRELIAVMLKIHQYIIMCAPTASQHAALKALESGFEDNFASVAEMHDQYDMRRRYCVKTLNDMGLECFEPRGAFYVFPRVSCLKMDGGEFANTLLQEEKIAVVPGYAFGESGKDFIRISYAYSIKNLMIAMERIQKFVDKRKKELKIYE